MNAEPIDHRKREREASASPFSLEHDSDYRAWRRRKLELRARLDPARVFRLDPGTRPSDALADDLARQLGAFNFILFESAGLLDEAGFLALNHVFGLDRADANPGADAVTSLYAVDAKDERAQYIPYTNRALNWHTDGYYNPPARRIGAFSLYCVEPASRGGANFLFDHEYLYLLLRDEDPELVAALMQEDLMQVPANVQQRRVVRAAESGPVFSSSRDGSGLHMRYTSRPRNILWKTDTRSERALSRLREMLLDEAAPTTIALNRRQGLICNNILHGREAFRDGTGGRQRRVLRARFHDAIDLDAALGVT